MMRSDRRRLARARLVSRFYTRQRVDHLVRLKSEDRFWIADLSDTATMFAGVTKIETHHGYVMRANPDDRVFYGGLARLYTKLAAGHLSLIAVEERVSSYSKRIYDGDLLAEKLSKGVFNTRKDISKSELKYCIKRLRFNLELSRIAGEMQDYFASPLTAKEPAVKALLERVRSAHRTVEGMTSVYSMFNSQRKISNHVFTHRGVLCAYEGLLQAHLGRWEMALPQLDLARAMLGRMIHLERSYRCRSPRVGTDGQVLVSLKEHLVDKLLREQLYQNYYRVLDILSQYSEQRARGLSGEAAQAHRIASQLYQHEILVARRFEPTEMLVAASDSKEFEPIRRELMLPRATISSLSPDLRGGGMLPGIAVFGIPVPSRIIIGEDEVPQEQVALVARSMLGRHLHYDVYYAGRFTVGFIRLMGLASVVAMGLVGASLLWPSIVSLSLAAGQGLLFSGMMAGFVSAFCAFKWLWLDAGRLQEQPLPKLSSVTPSELIARSAKVHVLARPGLGFSPLLVGDVGEELEPGAGVEARESRSPSR